MSSSTWSLLSKDPAAPGYGQERTTTSSPVFQYTPPPPPPPPQYHIQSVLHLSSFVFLLLLHHREEMEFSSVRNLAGESMKQRLKTSNQDKGIRPWADLPYHLLELVSKRLKLREYVSFRSVCRPWRNVKPQCFPQLMITTFKGEWDRFHDLSSREDGGRTKTVQSPYFVIDPKDRILHKCKLPEFERRNIVGSCHGWLILSVQGDPCECCLLNVFTRALMELPPLHLGRTTQGPTIYLSSAPTSPNCTILVLDSSISGLLYCKPGDLKWTEGECDYPFYSKTQQVRTRDYLHSVTAVGGKFYALSYQGKLVMIDDVVQPRTITVLPVDKIHPQFFPRREDKFLVESEGELLVVTVTGKTPPHEINVLRLDFQSMSWVKVTSLGDRVLFVGLNCSFSISASEIGNNKGNLVYFDHSNEHSRWSVFDLQSSQRARCQYVEHETAGCYAPLVYGKTIKNKTQSAWVLPTLSSQLE